MKRTEEHSGCGTEALLDRESKIRFQCRPGLSCFTMCCRDVNIFLSPYDILRMKSRIGIRSDAFLERYTKTLLPPSGGIPLIQLKMEGQEKRCPFVTEEGCTIYEDRPWACRMYPLDWNGEKSGYFFLVGEERCMGRRESKEWALIDWLRDQGIGPYEEMDLRFQIVTRYPRLVEAGIQDARIQHMFRMACYDLDTFRRFVFETRFLQLFEVEEEMVAQARVDDLALLELAFRWIRFGLVCGDVLPIRQEVIEERSPPVPGGSRPGEERKAKKGESK